MQDRSWRSFVTEMSHTRDGSSATVVDIDNKEAIMFDELTRELLDLTASVKGTRASRFAMVIECCCCSSCACVAFC